MMNAKATRAGLFRFVNLLSSLYYSQSPVVYGTLIHSAVHSVQYSTMMPANSICL